MRIKLNAHHRLGEDVLPKGSIQDLDEQRARQLIRMGAATELAPVGRRPPVKKAPETRTLPVLGADSLKESE